MPSMRGRASTSPTSNRSRSSLSRIRAPSSRCVISRPRNQIVALTLSPSRQPLARVLHPILVIVVVGAGTKLDLFDGDDDLFLLRLVRLLLGLVLKLAESIMRQTGGSAVAATSTRSKPFSRASRTASRVSITPSCSPSSPMTRTCGTRILSLMRATGARRLSGRLPATSKACSYCCTSSVKFNALRFQV